MFQKMLSADEGIDGVMACQRSSVCVFSQFRTAVFDCFSFASFGRVSLVFWKGHFLEDCDFATFYFASHFTRQKKDVCAALFCSRSQHQCCNSFPFGGTLNVCSGVCWSQYGTVWFAYGPHRDRDRARLALIMSKCSLVFWVALFRHSLSVAAVSWLDYHRPLTELGHFCFGLSVGCCYSYGAGTV